MRTRVVDKPAFILAGLAVDTSQASQAADAGPQPQASIDAWEAITAWRGRSDLVRTGAVSFEVHDARAREPKPEVEIWIPAVLA